jgi:hypothetical protein
MNTLIALVWIEALEEAWERSPTVKLFRGLRAALKATEGRE